MLSATEQWSALNDTFDLEKFYNLIVSLSECDPKDPWVVETLAFWNKEVPVRATLEGT